MTITKHIATVGIVAGALLFCSASFARDAQRSQPGDDRGRQAQAGDDRGGRDNSGPRVRVRVPLTGTILNGRTPRGHAEFRSEAGRMGLEVEAENVKLADGTSLLVQIDGTAVGMITLTGGLGELELNSQTGDTVPTVGPGTVVTVLASDGGLTVTVLTGHF